MGIKLVFWDVSTWIGSRQEPFLYPSPYRWQGAAFRAVDFAAVGGFFAATASILGARAPWEPIRRGCIVAALADATVRFVTDDVSLGVWRSLGTMAGVSGMESPYQP